MGNLARKVFIGSGTFTPPAGVTKVKVSTHLNQDKFTTGGAYRVLIDYDGQAWAWGQNTSGQLGDNTVVPKSSPVAVVGSNKFTQIFSNGGTLAIDDGGFLWSWGNNGLGQLGNGTSVSTSSPALVPIPVKVKRVYGLNLGQVVMGALASDGNLWMWGKNSSGVLGNGTTGPSSSPVAVSGGHTFTQFDITSDLGGVFGAIIALDDSGAAWGWGQNGNGFLGNGATLARSTPVAVLGGHTFQQIQVTVGSNGNAGTALGLDLQGNAWAWGYGGFGNLGDGTSASKSTPVAVIGGHKFKSIYGAYDSFLGLDLTGKLWSWGNNDSGQLGDGTVVAKSSPVAVLGGLQFTKVFVKNTGNQQQAYALDTSGQLWGWGFGSANIPLGDNSQIPRSSPVAIAVGRSLQLFAGLGTTVDSNGSPFDWGSNTNGQLGDNTVVAKSSPVAVVGPMLSIPLNSGNTPAIDFAVSPGVPCSIVMNSYLAWFNGTQIGVTPDTVVVEYEQ